MFQPEPTRSIGDLLRQLVVTGRPPVGGPNEESHDIVDIRIVDLYGLRMLT